MKEQSPDATQADLDFFYSKVDGALQSTQRYIKEELQDFATQQEKLEQQLATLTVGLAEQAVFIEAFMTLLESEPKEKQKIFTNQVKELRKLMIETLEYATDVVEDRNTEFEQPMENMAAENTAAPSGE
jgi:peptidoglycan hydrolase CwlO-like protein